jgi:hypothetical protein
MGAERLIIDGKARTASASPDEGEVTAYGPQPSRRWYVVIAAINYATQILPKDVPQSLDRTR